MKLSKIYFIHSVSDWIAVQEGKKLFWKTLKDYYLTLKTDKEKNDLLGMIFKDTKKEG